MKKVIIGLLLALVLVVGLNTVALASPSGTGGSGGVAEPISEQLPDSEDDE